jgi:hypothetical protein
MSRDATHRVIPLPLQALLLQRALQHRGKAPITSIAFRIEFVSVSRIDDTHYRRSLLKMMNFCLNLFSGRANPAAADAEAGAAILTVSPQAKGDRRKIRL